MGRNIKLNNTIITLLEQGIQNGLTIKLSCQHAGCSEASYFAWMNRGKNETDTVFAELYRRIKKAESNNALMNLALIQKQQKKEHGMQLLGCWRDGIIIQYVKIQS
jgi:Fe-S cluster assembly iron-binding protein IscA